MCVCDRRHVVFAIFALQANVIWDNIHRHLYLTWNHSLAQYPNIVPLQAIMGQTPPATQSAEIGNVVLGAMAQQAEQQASSATTTTPAEGGDGAIPATALNTMSWLAPQGKPAEQQQQPSETPATTDGTAAE